MWNLFKSFLNRLCRLEWEQIGASGPFYNRHPVPAIRRSDHPTPQACTDPVSLDPAPMHKWTGIPGGSPAFWRFWHSQHRGFGGRHQCYVSAGSPCILDPAKTESRNCVKRRKW